MSGEGKTNGGLEAEVKSIRSTTAKEEVFSTSVLKSIRSTTAKEEVFSTSVLSSGRISGLFCKISSSLRACLLTL